MNEEVLKLLSDTEIAVLTYAVETHNDTLDEDDYTESFKEISSKVLSALYGEYERRGLSNTMFETD